MRLWHSKLISLLDGRRLCDLHMSCCNLRGMGWGKRNVMINYIYDDPLGEDALAVYHHLVLKEMERRGYKFDPLWIVADYCGKRRPKRTCLWKNYKEACQRDVPLKSHNSAFLIRDAEVLNQRGYNLVITHDVNTIYNGVSYSVYTVHDLSTNKKVSYQVKL